MFRKDYDLPIWASWCSWDDKCETPCPDIAWDGVSQTFCPGCPRPEIFPIPAPQVTKITSLNHHIQPQTVLNLQDSESLTSYLFQNLTPIKYPLFKSSILSSFLSPFLSSQHIQTGKNICKALIQRKTNIHLNLCFFYLGQHFFFYSTASQKNCIPSSTAPSLSFAQCLVIHLASELGSVGIALIFHQSYFQSMYSVHSLSLWTSMLWSHQRVSHIWAGILFVLFSAVSTVSEMVPSMEQVVNRY
jgi:hypothetical protein